MEVSGILTVVSMGSRRPCGSNCPIAEGLGTLTGLLAFKCAVLTAMAPPRDMDSRNASGVHLPGSTQMPVLMLAGHLSRALRGSQTLLPDSPAAAWLAALARRQQRGQPAAWLRARHLQEPLEVLHDALHR